MTDFVIVWAYQVPEEHRAAFERAYGPDGAWARLFARDPGFRGTELIRGEAAGEYQTIDRWASSAAFERFTAGARDEYDRLDADLASLTETERLTIRGVSVG